MTFLTIARQQMILPVMALLILCGKSLPAQTYIPQATNPMQQQKTDSKPRQPHPRSAEHAASMQLPPAPQAIATQPPASPTPVLPANQPPAQARVSWDSRGLEIEASNSSLNQILHQVAADTGAKLEGLTQDQRVFGRYGPGPGRDVLWKLLEGSGYNVLMIGGRDADAPLEIVLSARLPASPQPAANKQNHSNPEDEEARVQLESEPRPQPTQNPFGIGTTQSDPQQLMQEILQRQQKIDQQQKDQQNNPQQ